MFGSSLKVKTNGGHELKQLLLILSILIRVGWTIWALSSSFVVFSFLFFIAYIYPSFPAANINTIFVLPTWTWVQKKLIRFYSVIALHRMVFAIGEDQMEALSVRRHKPKIRSNTICSGYGLPSFLALSLSLTLLARQLFIIQLTSHNIHIMKFSFSEIVSIST